MLPKSAVSLRDGLLTIVLIGDPIKSPRGRGQTPAKSVTAKIPQEVRRTLPVLADATTGEILWLPGYRVVQSVAVESPDAPSWRMTLRR